MRHRQAVRQGTLTPPSQVRLLLAQLCKKTCTEAELQPPVQVFLCAETGTGDGIGTVPPRKAFGRRSILLHLSEQKPLSLPSACGRYEIYHLKCLACPVYHARFILYIKTISLRRKKPPGFCTGRQWRRKIAKAMKISVLQQLTGCRCTHRPEPCSCCGRRRTCRTWSRCRCGRPRAGGRHGWPLPSRGRGRRRTAHPLSLIHI